MKRFFTILVTLIAGAIIGSAFTSTSRRMEYLPMVFKKRVSIAPATNAVPDTNVLLQIGDADSSRLGAIRFYWTDTAKVTQHKKRGVVIFNSVDTTLYIYTGSRWKKLGS